MKRIFYVTIPQGGGGGSLFSSYVGSGLASTVHPKNIRNFKHPQKIFERGSCMVWEINMGVCPCLDFENIMLFNCLGYNFNIYSAFEFLCNSIANL